MADLWGRFWGLSWWLKGTAIFVAVLIVGGIIGAATGSGGNDDDTEVVAPTTAAGETTAPDESVATDKPVDTEVPTEPSLPAVSASECAYLNDLQGILDTTGTASGDIGEAFQEAGEDPTLIFDQGWIIETASAMAMIQVSHDQLGDLSPPESLAEIHTVTQDALSKMNEATNAIASGIDNIDADQITEGSTLFVSATNDIGTATGLLDDFMGARSGSC